MNVDDQEYEEFLKSEFNNASNRKADFAGSKSNPFKDGKQSAADKNGSLSAGKLSKKEQQNLINELAFPRASSENLDLSSEQDPAQAEKGWQNLWNQTQLEIQELEMRANAIKAMMEKSKTSRSTDRSDEKDGQLLDNIESEDEFVSDGEYKNESDLSNSSPRRSRSKSHKSDLDKPDKRKRSTSKELRRSNSKENRRRSKERTEKRAKDRGRSRSRNRSSRAKSDRAGSEKGRQSESKEESSKSKEKRPVSNSPDEEKQIREAVEGEFLDIKVEQRKAGKRGKQVSTKPDVNRLSMESGEILDDDDDDQVNRAIEVKRRRNARSPSVTSSVDEFGRNRRRKRRSKSFESTRRNSKGRESDSLSSLDEILREAELEEQHSAGNRLRSRISQEHATSTSKSHGHHHHSHHHRKPKRERPAYVDLDEPKPDTKPETASEEGEMA